MSKWRTAITGHFENEAYLRGYKLIELVGKLSFSEAIFLLLKGKLPNQKEKKIMETIFVSSIDHGIAPPSIVSARTVFSGCGSLNTAVAAGVSSLGDHHGGAIEQCAKVLQEGVIQSKSAKEIVKHSRDAKIRLPGYGHKIYKDEDPRSKALLDIAKENGFYGKHAQLALDIQKEIDVILDKKLCLNVDGAIAAIISEMGFDWKLGKGFFIIARTPGIVAHVYEEWVREAPFRRLSDEEIEYDGEKPRKL